MLRRSASAVAAAMLLAGGLGAFVSSADAATPRCPRFGDGREGSPGYPPANCKLKLNKTWVYAHTVELISAAPGSYGSHEVVNIDIRDGHGASQRVCTQTSSSYGSIYIYCAIPAGLHTGDWFISGLGTHTGEWRTADLTVH